MNQTATYQTASRGFAWSFLASAISNVASLAAQLCLGWLLSEGDFGEYAIAIGFANFIAVFREGGITRWLARMEPAEFDENLSATQGLSYLLSWAFMPILFVLGWFAGGVYESVAVRNVMWILALAFPFNGYGTVGRAKLQSTLRFASLARLKIVTDILRYSLIILFAFLGFGAVSFALPAVVVAVVECAGFRLLTGLPLSDGVPSVAEISAVFRRSKWSLYGALASSLVRNCDYVILGLLVSKEVVGAYFFAFQLTMQPVTIFGESLRKVVLPVFARLESDTQRRKRALALAGVFLGTVAAPLMFLLSALAEHVTVFLWGDRWLSAVEPIRILSVAMVFQLASLVSEVVVQSHGRFRSWALAVFCRGVGLGVCALFAGQEPSANATSIAQIIAAYLVASALVEIALLLRTIGMRWSDLLWPALVPLLCCGLAAYSVTRIDAAWSQLTGLTAIGVLSVAYFLILGMLLAVFCRKVADQAIGMAKRLLGGGERQVE